MPLHLLGKKSWNVYNPENIARVQRDEAAAKSRDEREEREQHDNEAATRLQILRGETIPEPNNAVISDTPFAVSHDRSRKRRKLRGEDDTDRDIRFAKADAEANDGSRHSSSIFDSKGHIDLVPQRQRSHADQKESVQNEESVGMRFKDAGGYRSDNKPWYNDRTTDVSSRQQVSKDVWGNEDPRRREREQQRMSANDPLLAMKKGVRQLRENERQRKEWMKQRELDLHEVERLARERSRRRRRHRGGSSDEDSLEDFSLDGPSTNKPSRDGKEHDRQHRHHHSKHRHRSRSPDREHRRHKYRHRHGTD